MSNDFKLYAEYLKGVVEMEVSKVCCLGFCS
jgi:hypothetical protein